MSEEQPSNPLSPETQARIRELQALITDQHRKADKTDDEDIREAHNLQISKIGLKITRLRRGLPEELPSEVEKTEEEDLEPLPKPTEEQLKEADLLVQRAVLEKRRGNRQGAADLLKKAAEVAPGSATVLEALGDDLVERKHFAAAQEAYKSARRADPTNASIERKYAQLSTIALANLSVEDQMRLMQLDNPFIQKDEAIASPMIAMILTIIIPGLGQFVTGQTRKGATIFIICVVCAVAFGAVGAAGHGGSPSLRNIPTIAWFAAILGIATWFGGIIDASIAIKRPGGAKPGAPAKPVPPVNLPFE